ncbi:MAG: multicopper oxidase family protein [Halobacteriaceae archaeon]
MSDTDDDRRHRVDRRTVLRALGAAGAAGALPWAVQPARAVTPSTDIDLSDYKWDDPLPRPGVMSPASRQGGVERYEIPLTQFDQQVLPSTLPDAPATRLWGYGGTYPAATIEARPGRAVEVTWDNRLPSDGHLLSVDEHVHGAEPPAPAVRNVVHVHGAVTTQGSDGYPEAWATPDGKTAGDYGLSTPVSYQQSKRYPNEQDPATLWYHDHALGITRLNVYAGLAGFWLLRHPAENSLPKGEYEVPILVQDRSFRENGNLKYPSGTNDDYEAEVFGDVPVVNGKAYPYLEVEPREYRFRFLNGSNGRAFNLRLRNDGGGTATGVPVMKQIGVDQGFLPGVVDVGPGGDVPSLLLSGAERADVVVDFSGYEGTTFTLTNDAEAPYTGANSGSDVPEILQIRVGTGPAAGSAGQSPEQFLASAGNVVTDYQDPVTPSGTTRQMTLDSMQVDVGESLAYDTHLLNMAGWDEEETWNGDPAVVEPTLGTSEEWVIANTTPDSHPIHTHLVDFEVLKRLDFDAAGFNAARQTYLADDTGTVDAPVVSDYVSNPSNPTPNNAVKKDTVLVNPDEAVRIRPAFTGYAGRFAWHCHVLEHEDQEMMLPFEVVEP